MPKAQSQVLASIVVKTMMLKEQNLRYNRKTLEAISRKRKQVERKSKK